jgi:hypothetical protein
VSSRTHQLSPVQYLRANMCVGAHSVSPTNLIESTTTRGNVAQMLTRVTDGVKERARFGALPQHGHVVCACDERRRTCCARIVTIGQLRAIKVDCRHYAHDRIQAR